MDFTNIRVEKEEKVLFVIGTPFQALCSVEAIQRFSIANFDIFVCYFSNENRINQIASIFKYYGIKFSSIQLNKKNAFVYSFRFLTKRENYSLSFVGIFYSILYSLFSVLSLRRCGRLYYIDDGNSTIEVFQDTLSPTKTKKSFRRIRYIVNSIAAIKKIEVERFFFSIYNELPNPKYVIIDNDFRAILSNFREISTEKKSYFIGTVTEGFCSDYGIDKNDYYSVLESILKKTKSLNSSIIYIPHGRDRDENVRNICKKLNVEYCSINVCVELFFLQNGIVPSSLIGFASSALFTIKRMFPNTIVQNVRIVPSYNNLDTDKVADYYREHGIESIVFTV